MSSLAEKLLSINDLRREIEAMGKLSDEVRKKIEYKFRLECNYHSNRIEGGTLTKQETRTIMIDNINVEGKPLKDIREMRGHDDAMLQILKIGKGELRLSPGRIKSFHKLIIVEDDPKKQSQIGEWKPDNNEIINYRLEKFNFTDYSLVPEKMQELLNWLNAGLDRIWEKKKNAPDPLLLAFEFQLRFLTIHPFMEGNGRTARLATNLILVSLGYPPIWVKEGDEKEAYNRYLGDIQGYGGSPDLFYEFMADLVLRSLQLTKDAIEGKEIEDVDDWQKKLRLMKSKLSSERQDQLPKTTEAIINVFENNIYPCIEKLIEKMGEFDELFESRKLCFGDSKSLFTVNSAQHINSTFMNRPDSFIDQLVFDYGLNNFKKNNRSFSIVLSLLWRFNKYDYDVLLTDLDKIILTKNYGQNYSADEIKQLIRIGGDKMIEQINEGIDSPKMIKP